MRTGLKVKIDTAKSNKENRKPSIGSSKPTLVSQFNKQNKTK